MGANIFGESALAVPRDAGCPRDPVVLQASTYDDVARRTPVAMFPVVATCSPPSTPHDGAELGTGGSVGVAVSGTR